VWVVSAVEAQRDDVVYLGGVRAALVAAVVVAGKDLLVASAVRLVTGFGAGVALLGPRHGAVLGALAAFVAASGGRARSGGSWHHPPMGEGQGLAHEVYMRFVDRVAKNLVQLGVCAAPDRDLAEKAIEAVRRATNARIRARE
jgi:hypothetical protein